MHASANRLPTLIRCTVLRRRKYSSIMPHQSLPCYKCKEAAHADLLHCAQARETQVNHAKAAIAMLTTTHELYKRSSQRANRLIYHIGALLAREHLAAEDVDTAQKLLHSIAGERAVVALPCLGPALPWPCPVRLLWPCPVMMRYPALPCPGFHGPGFHGPALPCPALPCGVMVVCSPIHARKVLVSAPVHVFWVSLMQQRMQQCFAGQAAVIPLPPAMMYLPLIHPYLYPSTHLNICLLAPCNDVSPTHSSTHMSATAFILCSFTRSLIHSCIQPFSLLQLLQVLFMHCACGQLHLQCVTVLRFLYRGVQERAVGGAIGSRTAGVA